MHCLTFISTPLVVLFHSVLTVSFLCEIHSLHFSCYGSYKLRGKQCWEIFSERPVSPSVLKEEMIVEVKGPISHTSPAPGALCFYYDSSHSAFNKECNVLHICSQMFCSHFVELNILPVQFSTGNVI